MTIMDKDNNITNGTLPVFEVPEKVNIIKVIGVGGGGGNAVNHMYKEGIHDVSFALCNTDAQSLNASPVPVHIMLRNEELCAMSMPKQAREIAEDTIDDIKHMLDDGTKMTFITAGMGGCTGTGAAPVIARVSKEMGILTVGIVTIPFLWEGEKKINRALDGVEELAKNVDALLVINNERLREVYADFSLLNAWEKVDDTLSMAAKSIAEIITSRGIVNLNFNDVRTVLEDGGVAIMSTGYGEGEGRLRKAIESALHSPLLNNNDIYNSKKILLSITLAADKSNNEGLRMEELNEVNEFMSHFNCDYQFKWGIFLDPNLGEKVKVTILATGFGIKNIDGMQEHQTKKYTQEEADNMAKKAEADAQKKARMGVYYGSGEKAMEYKRRPHIFLFSPEYLDNEDVILAIENTPTYKRSKNMIDEITRQASGHTESKPADDSGNDGTANSIISFV